MGLKQKVVAENLGISTSYLSEILTGKKKPTIELAQRIEEYTNNEVRRLDVLYPVKKQQTEDILEQQSNMFISRGTPLTPELCKKVLSGN